MNERRPPGLALPLGLDRRAALAAFGAALAGLGTALARLGSLLARVGAKSAGAGTALGGLSATLAGCGYRPLRSLPAAPGELSVTAAPSQVPDVTLVGDAVYGAQVALAREARLGGGAYPRLVVELVRVDERSSGVRDVGGQPLARGVSLGLLGRAWVLDAPDATARFDTGDVRVVTDVAAEADLRVDTLRRDDALRSLARRLGEALAGRVLGLPTPLDERL